MDNKQSEDGMAKMGLINVNNLQYNLKPDLSVCVSNTSTSQFFQNQSYAAGSTMVCILNTGSSFVYGPNSSLVWDVKNVTGSGNFNFGAAECGGTSANLISRVTIMSRSGVVLERIDGSNVLSAIKVIYNRSLGWNTSIGQAAGIGRGIGAGATARFVVPMSLLSGLFAYENLLPSALMSGLRIEFVLAPPVQALLSATNTSTYEISSCRIETDAYQLTDMILRQLNETAASSGLEVVFKTVFNTVATRTTNSINLESRRSCSRALCAFYRETAVRDNLTSEPMGTLDVTSTQGLISGQFRAGSLYFPNSVISGSTPDVCAPEAYFQTLKGMNRYNRIDATSPASSFESYVGSTSKKGANLFAVSLERSTTLELAGIPLSNSRTLALNATFIGDTGHNVNFFLEYATLARVFISNCTVEV